MSDRHFQRAVGTFPTHQEAKAALTQLRDLGFDMDRIRSSALGSYLPAFGLKTSHHH
ncbi:MAG: hypothetical protein AAFQ41_14275 [Cyanobacteria bacterium J06623_7]